MKAASHCKARFIDRHSEVHPKHIGATHQQTCTVHTNLFGLSTATYLQVLMYTQTLLAGLTSANNLLYGLLTAAAVTNQTV